MRTTDAMVIKLKPPMYHVTSTPGELLSSKLQISVGFEILSLQTQLIRK